MNPVWAIQTNAVSYVQAEAVANAVTLHGGKALEVEVLPAWYKINFINESEPSTRNIIPYGSTKFVELAMEKGWLGVFRNSNFAVPVWNEKRSDMLNADSVNMQVSELPAFMQNMPDEAVMFIRPMMGKKLFAGQGVTVSELKSWIRTGRAGKYLFLPETEVSIATAKTIHAETRWFVVNGKVIDGSTYRLRGHGACVHDGNENNLKEAQKLADVWLPHPTCVMDLANTDEGLKVIEFNTFNSSGFYHHDISKIVKAVHDSLNN